MRSFGLSIPNPVKNLKVVSEIFYLLTKDNLTKYKVSPRTSMLNITSRVSWNEILERKPSACIRSERVSAAAGSSASRTAAYEPRLYTRVATMLSDYNKLNISIKYEWLNIVLFLLYKKNL